MRNPDRIPKIINKLRNIWLCNPELRLGQLLINVFRSDFYYMEDDELIEQLEKFYEFSKNRKK